MASARVVVQTSVTKRVADSVDRSLGIFPYDGDNKYPQRVENARAASGTASACVKEMKRFLRGRGYDDPALESLVVNHKGQTLAEIHELICQDRSTFEGYAFIVGYNALFEVTSIQHVPFAHCRLKYDGETMQVSQVLVHPDWGRERLGVAWKKSDAVAFDVFTNDPQKRMAQVRACGGFQNWNGHIVYVSAAGHLTYPLSTFDAVMEDVLTERGIKTCKYRWQETGFMASHLLAVPRFESDEDRNEFDENLKEFQGADRSQKIVLVEFDSKEQMPEVKPFTVNSQDGQYQWTESSVRDNIIRQFGQPLALHAIQAGGSLGMSKEFEEAKVLYDEKTADLRNQLAAFAADQLAMWSGGNPAKKGFQVVPITGIKAVQDKAPLAATLGVGGLQSLQAIIVDTALTPQQKINIMVSVFGVPEQDAVNIITPPTNG